MAQMEQVTQQAAANAEESASASETMSTQAENDQSRAATGCHGGQFRKRKNGNGLVAIIAPETIYDTPAHSSHYFSSRFTYSHLLVVCATGR